MKRSAHTIRLIVQLEDAQRSDLREAVKAIRERGHVIEVRVAWEPADTATLSREACAGGLVQTIVAAGGDGTLNAVAGGILQSSAEKPPSLGVLPLGTANDFARAIGVLPDDLVEALRIAAECPAIPIDIAQVGDRYFLNVATGGVGTSVTVETPETMKDLLGKAAYFITGVRKLGDLEPRKMHLRVNRDFDWEGPILVLAVGNGRTAGGGFDLCPRAKLNDALLEISIVPDADPDHRTLPLREIIQGGIGNVSVPNIQKRASELTICSEAPFQLNLDGEPLEGKKFQFRAIPGALRFHLPANCPLVG